MDRTLAFNCVAAIALFVLVCSTATATAQAGAACTGDNCGQVADRPPASAAEIYERKQEFVAALRQLAISLAGRFGNEGLRLQSDIDSLNSALRRWDDAIAGFEKTLAQHGDDADAYTAAGAVYLDRYRTDDALRSFEAAAKLDAGRADVQKFIAMTFALVNKPSDAARAWARAAAIQPDDAAVGYEVARYAMETGGSSTSTTAFDSFQEAAARQLAGDRVATAFMRPGLLRQTAGVAPIFPPAPYVHAFELLTNGKFAEAIAECRTVAADDPLTRAPSGDDPLVAGAEALGRGELTVALKYLGTAVDASPSRSEAHRIFAVASRLDEQLEQSIDAYKTAIRLWPADERSRMGLADVLMDMERFTEAKEVLEETIRVVPQTVQAHYRLGRLYQSIGNYQGALDELVYATRFPPLVGQDPLHEMVALIYASQADFERASEALRKQVAVNPNNADAHRRLGDSYARQERTREALAEFTAALLVDRSSVLSYVGISQIHFRAGNYQPAADAAASALAIDRSQREARYVLAMSLLRMGKTDDGNRELQEFQRLQAELSAETQRKFEMDGLKRQIAVSLDQKDYQAAIPLLRQAIEWEPDAAAHFTSLGHALAMTGHIPEAIQMFEAAVQREALNPDVHRQLAEAYLTAGRVDASRKEADRYRQLIEIAKKQRALRFANP